jgi:small subunit ribosomal protein S8
MGVITDPIADMLARIRNANLAFHESVAMPLSKVKREVARILKEEGFIRDFEVVDNGTPQATLRITLKYGPERERVITGMKRISRPGLRVYSSKTEIPRVLGGLGIVIVSTSKGIMTGRAARREGCGGEVLAQVW